jgi:hypothetical protein
MGTATEGGGGGRATLHIRHHMPRPLPGSARAALAYPPCRSVAPLLAVNATYRTGGRHSTTPRIIAHRCRWCRRCSWRTRRPSRRRTRYAAPGPVCHARAASPHPPPASWLSRPSARLVCHVQLGRTPLHVAAARNSSSVAVAVVQALLAAYPEAAKATDKVRRQRQHRWRDGGARAPVCCAIVVRASRPPSASPLTTLSLRRCRPPRARAAGRQDAGRLRRQVQWERRGQGLVRKRQGAPDSRAVGADAWPRVARAPRPHTASVPVLASRREEWCGSDRAGTPPALVRPLATGPKTAMMVIRGTQRHSEALRDHERPSVAITCNQRQ